MPVSIPSITHLQHRDCIWPDEKLRKAYDKRSLIRKVVDIILSLFRELAYTIHSTIYRAIVSPLKYHPLDHQIEWKNNSKGLFVFVHGLSAHPSVWDKHLSLITDPTIDIYVPFVPHAGICSLDDAVEPIIERTVDYVTKNPKSPVCFIGHSNGGRGALELERLARERIPKTDIRVSTIAAIHFGTPLITTLKNWGIAQWCVNPIVCQEIERGSKRANQLLDEIEKPIPKGNGIRSYEFYASTEDMFAVSDLGCSLPVLFKGEKHRVVHGYNHSSMISAVAVQQVNKAMKWINERNKIRREEELNSLAWYVGPLQFVWNTVFSRM